MQTKLNRSLVSHVHQRGATLLTTIMVTALLGLTLITYLNLVNSQNQLVTRSQVWNACMPILEAGIEEALTHAQQNYVTNMASNGWALYNGTYVKSNAVGEGYYLTAISQTLPYEIVSRGYLPFAGTSTILSRTVKATTAPQSVFNGAMIMRNTINMNGNNVLTDSYDSEDDTKSTFGKYDPSKAGDNGDVGCVGGLIDAIRLGNADVWGHVITGPLGTVRVGAQGSVGSVAWHKGANYGIQDTWWIRDMNMNFPTVEAPFSAAPPPISDTINGVAYDYVLGNGNYLTPTLSGKVLVQGEATLYVPGDVTFSSDGLIEIAPGAKLTLYVGGAKSTINTVINGSANAGSFTYFGLPTNRTIIINGGGELTAAVYAPEASISFNGDVEYYGSLIGNDATLNGNGAFHYDDALGRAGPRRALIITSWKEI